MQAREQIYLNGEWARSTNQTSIEVVNHSNEKVIGSIPACNKNDVDLAITAAKQAFPAWSALHLEERLNFIEELGKQLAARSELIGQLISQEVGMPLGLSTMIQAGLPAGTTTSVPITAREFPFEETIGRSLVTR